MTRRMIDSSMWSNENFAALPAMARLLQIGMINHADDQGRIKANPLYLGKEIFPYDRVTPVSVTKWLEQIAANGTVILYMVEGKQYAQLTKWWDYQSLQYAAPSDYPTPPHWKDRIRRTATKMVIVTYNWTLTNGVTVPDTCDERGKPLTPQPAAQAKLTHPSTPPSSRNGHLPDNSPIDSPESPPDDSIYSLNLIELNLNQDQGGDRACAQPEIPPPPTPPIEIHARNGANSKLRYQSPHIDKTHFDPVTGFVSPGKGTTAVEVYYERFDVCHNDERLTSPMEDDLVEFCPDLERLREAVTAYSRAGYKTQRNIKLILDWYREPSRYQRDKSSAAIVPTSNRGNGNLRGAEKNMSIMDQFEELYGDMEIPHQ